MHFLVIGNKSLLSMGEGKGQAPKLATSCDNIEKHANPDHNKWLGMEYSHDNEDDTSNTSSSTSNGSSSSSSSSSSDMIDDASSSSSNSNGSLFELSELMAHLPIKRGLSKYYQGKSESFTSLSGVTSIEDLPKKETPYKRKMKSSKSYANGLDAHKPYTLPKAIISKKVPRSYMSSISFPGRRGSFLSSRPPVIPVQKKV